jgi:hypothetical protein
MSRNAVLALVIGGLVFACLLASCGSISAYNNLIGLQETRAQAEGDFDATVDLMTPLIEGVLSVMDDTFAAETQLQTEVAALRTQGQAYLDAVARDDPGEIIAAANGFNLSFQAVAEATPTTNFADLGIATQREIEVSFNQMLTALKDVNETGRRYNTYRRSLIFPAIIGGIAGFPARYEEYEGVNNLPTSFDQFQDR